MRIPTKKIAHSELKTIRASPSDAGKSIVRQVIVMSQEKGWGYKQHHFVSVAADGCAGASQSNPDVNGNIINTWSYDWNTIVTANTNGLVTNVSGTQLQTSVMTYNEGLTGALYWNPNPSIQSGSLSQPNLRAITSLAVNGLTTNSSSATYSYDNAATTANLTRTVQLGGSGGISQSWTYNQNGNVISQTDPNGNITVTCYNDSYSLYPSTIVVAATPGSTCPNPTESSVGRTSTYTTDFFSGVTLTATDADNNITNQGNTYDNLGRHLTATQNGAGYRGRRRQSTMT